MLFGWPTAAERYLLREDLVVYCTHTIAIGTASINSYVRFYYLTDLTMHMEEDILEPGTSKLTPLVHPRVA